MTPGAPMAPRDAALAARGPEAPRSVALLTDHYELTMVDAALQSGIAERRAVFEVWTRSLPPGRRYGVVAGTGRLMSDIADFRFGEDDLRFLAERGVVGPGTLEWLAAYRFTGDVDGYPEGEAFFPESPVLTVEGPFAQALVLETLILSILNHDSAIAAAASRMATAAGGRTLIEMGSRRTHEDAAVAAARAARIVGFDTTSNLRAGQLHGIPTAGTVAHAFILAHDSELAAFRAQMRALGTATTLLVDTYGIEDGIRTAVQAARDAGVPGPGAIRIDSGDLAVETRRARHLLDSLGATATRIVISGDLDEFRIAGLRAASAPIDAFGVGTSLVTGSGHPTAGFIYKLVAIEADGVMRPVHKTQAGKATVGGRKTASRILDASGRAEAELVAAAESQPAPSGATPSLGTSRRALQVSAMRGGEVTWSQTIEEARARHRLGLAELPEGSLRLDPGPPALPTIIRAADDHQGCR